MIRDHASPVSSNIPLADDSTTQSPWHIGGENQLWSIRQSGSGWAVPPRKAPLELGDSERTEDGWCGTGPPPSSSTSCSGILGPSRPSATSTLFHLLPKPASTLPSVLLALGCFSWMVQASGSCSAVQLQCRKQAERHPHPYVSQMAMSQLWHESAFSTLLLHQRSSARG